jgi:hypothetical protein
MGLQVRCSCGKQAAIQVGSIGRPFTCGACRGRAVVVWGIDPRSKKAAPIALEASPGTPRGFKIPLGMSELPCPCGARLFARPRQTGKRVQCPVCATWLKLEHSRDPQTLETRIRVVKSRLNQLPAVPPPPARPKAGANVEFILCSCGESIRVEATSAGNQAKCPACGALIRLEMTQNSETSCFVVDPGVPGPSQFAEKRGIDEELSLEDFG